MHCNVTLFFVLHFSFWVEKYKTTTTITRQERKKGKEKEKVRLLSRHLIPFALFLKSELYFHISFFVLFTYSLHAGVYLCFVFHSHTQTKNMSLIS